jgi:hypothetical protein
VSARGMDFPDVTRVIQVRRRRLVPWCRPGERSQHCCCGCRAVLCAGWTDGSRAVHPPPRPHGTSWCVVVAVLYCSVH